MREHLRRPRAIIAICILLLWSLAIDVHRWPYLIRAAYRGEGWRGWFDVATGAILVVLPFVALVALVGLRRLRPWGSTAFGVWAVLAALQTGLVLFLVAALWAVEWTGWLAVGGIWLAAAGILFALWRYLRGVLHAVASRPAGVPVSDPNGEAEPTN